MGDTTGPVSPSIDATLAERGSRYGNFRGHARITQALKTVMHMERKWGTLTKDKQEALDMIAHKIGRILNGDPEYHDSWHDIVGYAKLVADTLLPSTPPPSVASAPNRAIQTTILPPGDLNG